MLDVFRLDDRLYVRPIKVQYRSRDAMNTTHVRQGDAFLPVKRVRCSPNPFPHAVAAVAERPSQRLLAEAFPGSHTVVQEFQAGQCPAERYDDMLRRVAGRCACIVRASHHW